MNVNKTKLIVLILTLILNYNVVSIKINKKIIKGPFITINSSIIEKDFDKKIDNIVIFFTSTYAKELNNLLKAQKELLDKMKAENVNIPETPEIKSDYNYRFSESLKKELNKYGLQSYNILTNEEQYVEEEFALKKLKEYNSNLVLTILSLPSKSTSSGSFNTYIIQKDFPFEINLKFIFDNLNKEIWNAKVKYECKERQEGGYLINNELDDEELLPLVEKIINKFIIDLKL